MKLDPFYPIIDSADWLQRLLPLGVKLVQLRMKDRQGNIPEEQHRRQQIIQSRELCKAHNCQLVINDFWQLAIEEKCQYVHLGQEDLMEADLKSIRKADIKLGISTHSDEELQNALRCDPDYVALGPIYPTILKEMKWQPQGLEKIGLWKKRIGDIPLCAIGGISLERLQGVMEAGADLASVVTDITLHESPEKRCIEWLEKTRAWS